MKNVDKNDINVRLFLANKFIKLQIAHQRYQAIGHPEKT